ncbi:MAG: hypothetical protein LKH74_02695 [Levilactobacillus sp.]|uniref:hypothetical protein n=1 Tax=Levilactobacillus sp. TaxID=2767919 RepID=UPI00259000E0|nr:hypothetical protein [Levilactobacillus sp.]MCH4124410.1 hypothetical protein [Levilactobacillus sp.]MCI1552820.1 hypothetical protein [Levilactobacillus sp.]MCI1599838.1 hypothetical protein [Levilactobacillus sp.]MCI1605496.1 hypothetical protein [Levilactobacillus sp.]
MKLVTSILVVVLTAGIVGGTIWLMLTLAIAAWLEVLIGVVGFVLATVVNLLLFWFLWPRTPSFEDDDE